METQSEPKRLGIFEKHQHTYNRDLLERQGIAKMEPLPIPAKPSWHFASYRCESGEAAMRLGYSPPALTITLVLESDLPAAAFENAAAKPLLAEIAAALEVAKEKFLAGDESQVKANARRKQLADSEAELAQLEATRETTKQKALAAVVAGTDSGKLENTAADCERKLPLVRERIGVLKKLLAESEAAAEQKLANVLTAKNAELREPYGVKRDALRRQIADTLGKSLIELKKLSAVAAGY